MDEYTNEDDNGEEDEDESGADTGDDENEVDGRPEAEEETSEPEGNEEESLRGKHCVIEWEKRWLNGQRARSGYETWLAHWVVFSDQTLYSLCLSPKKCCKREV